MTRMDRAIQELKKAAGRRPWVLVYLKTHDDASQEIVAATFENGRVAALGLLNAGLELVKQPYGNFELMEYEEDDDDGDLPE